MFKVGETEFTKTKYDALDGTTTIGFVTSDSSFQLKANRAGLVLEGRFELTTEQELQDFAKLMADAWTERRKLKPKIQTSLSGH